MSSLSDIPVRVEGPAPTADDPGGLGGGVVAILHEVLALAERLHRVGEPGAIDLHSMPMIPGDRERLQQALGAGELSAVLDDGTGISRIRETGVSGVWWIEHRGPDDEIVADMIEVTSVPQLLVSQPDDVRRGVRRLRRQLEADATTEQASEQG